MGSEPEWVYDTIAKTTGIGRPLVVDAVTDFRRVVDGLICDDYGIMMSPLEWSQDGDPVFQAIHDHLDDPAWIIPDDVEIMEYPEIASTFGLDEDLASRYPVAWWPQVLANVLDLRELENEHPDFDVLADVLDAWIETYGDDAPPDRRWQYRVDPAGRESAFDAYLRDHFGVLGNFGYTVDTTTVQQQVRLSHGRLIPDFICRLEDDHTSIKSGDWLVIENKTTMGDLAALKQLEGYVDAAQTELATGEETVFGLLLADGVTVRLNERMETADCGYISLSGLGYRDHLYETDQPVVEPDADDPRLDSTIEHSGLLHE